MKPAPTTPMRWICAMARHPSRADRSEAVSAIGHPHAGSGGRGRSPRVNRPRNCRTTEKKAMKHFSILLAGMAALAVMAGPASAATSTVTGTITAGTLSLATSATPSFGVTLDGTDKTATYTVPATVTDATGSDSGWNLT